MVLLDISSAFDTVDDMDDDTFPCNTEENTTFRYCYYTYKIKQLRTGQLNIVYGIQLLIL